MDKLSGVKNKLWYKTLRIFYILLFLYLVFLMWVFSIKSIMPYEKVDVNNSFLVCEDKSPQSLYDLMSKSKLFISNPEWFPDNEDRMSLEKICGNTNYKLNIKEVSRGSWIKYCLTMSTGILILLFIFWIIRKTFFYFLK